MIGLCSIGSASAAVVTSLSDDFTSNGQVAALNWTGDSVFKPVPKSAEPWLSLGRFGFVDNLSHARAQRFERRCLPIPYWQKRR